MKPEQKQRRELTKFPSQHDPWYDARASFCSCGAKGCGVRCPCAKNGIGCWWEINADDKLNWGCACQGRCSAAVGVYICDLPVVHQARRERLSELQERDSLDAANGDEVGGRSMHVAEEAMTLDELAGDRGEAPSLGVQAEEAMSLDELVCAECSPCADLVQLNSGKLPSSRDSSS